MKRSSKEDLERHYFEQFRTVYELPPGEVHYTDKPDVIVRGSDVLGIEIEQLYIASGSDPASEQMQRPRRERALALAQEIHLSAGGKRFELSIDFNQGHPITDEKSLAQRLADLAKRIEGQSAGRVSPQLFGDLPELRFVYLNRRNTPMQLGD